MVRLKEALNGLFFYLFVIFSFLSQSINPEDNPDNNSHPKSFYAKILYF